MRPPPANVAKQFPGCERDAVQGRRHRSGDDYQRGHFTQGENKHVKEVEVIRPHIPRLRLGIPAHAAEREQVRMVINLAAAVKKPFPRNLRNNVARTERVQLDSNGATMARLRSDDKQRWCYEAHCTNRRAPIRCGLAVNPPLGCRWGKPIITLMIMNGAVDVGSTIRLEGQPHAP
jgi:hypothetical protein